MFLYNGVANGIRTRTRTFTGFCAGHYTIATMVSPARIERTTYGLEVRRSVLLSYGDQYDIYLIPKKGLNGKEK